MRMCGVGNVVWEVWCGRCGVRRCGVGRCGRCGGGIIQ